MTDIIAAMFSTTLLVASSAVCNSQNTGVPSLRAQAAKKHILIGSGAVSRAYLDDIDFAAVLADQFNSLSPENDMKWSFIHPSKDHYNWELLDRLVAFAEDNDMAVKGHGLISSCCNPAYLLNMTNPD